MYCRKCTFTSHDHLQKCPKCGASWEEDRKELGLAWMTEPKGVWLEAAHQEELSLALEPEFPGEEPLFLDAPGGDSGDTEIPEALRGMDTDITAPTDPAQEEPDKKEIPEPLQDMDMRITTPEDGKTPVQEEGDIEFPGLANPLLGREETAPPPERAKEPELEEIIGVDFSLDEDIFEDIEEIRIPDTEKKEVVTEQKASPAAPPADIEFADLLDLEELLAPTDEKKG